MPDSAPTITVREIKKCEVLRNKPIISIEKLSEFQATDLKATQGQKQ